MALAQRNIHHGIYMAIGATPKKVVKKIRNECIIRNCGERTVKQGLQ